MATRVERHIIKTSHVMWKSCDDLCFKSKNLYNYANYIQRQLFADNDPIMKYIELTFSIKHSNPFKDLGSNSAQHTLKMLDRDWKSFFVAIKDYSKYPYKYLGKPKIPKYKDKNGRCICMLTNLQTQIKDGYLYFAFTRLKPFNNLIKTNIKGKHMQTRIIPKGGCYALEIVYETETPDLLQQNNRIVGIDLGVNNLATCVNNIGIKPIVINGRPLKSMNQYFNKKKSYLQSSLKKSKKRDWSNKLQALQTKRDNKIDNYLHCSSKSIISYCIGLNIDTIVIGLNKTWKQKCNIGNINNQNFISIPYEKFINQITYKAESVGIRVMVSEESYTSGCSFLDNENLCKENYNKSRRIKRGLFKSNNGTLINSDVNGAYNIIKKVVSDAFANEVEGVDLHPIRVSV